MAKRLEGIFKDYYNLTYKIEIYDSEYSGEVIPFETAPPGVIWDYESSNNEPLTRVLITNANVTIYIQNADHQSFLDDLLLSDESQFYLTITATGNTSVIEFFGFIMVDQLSLEDMETPTLTINATDPLVKLKDIPYRAEDFSMNIIERATFKEHLFNILSLLEAEDFFGSSAAVQVTCNWYESTMKNTTDNPMEMSRCAFSVFAEQQDAGDYKYYTCYEALEMICTLWNARLYFSQGLYKFEQINQRANEVVDSYFYLYNGTGGTKIPNSADAVIDNETIYKLRGGTFNALPPVRAIQLQYDFNINDNYLHGLFDAFNSNLSILYDLGFLDLDDDIDFKFLLSGILTWYMTTTAPLDEIPDFKIRYRVYIKIGDKYLKRSIIDDDFYLPTYGPAEWSDIPADYFFETSVINFISGGRFEGEISIDLLTPIIEEGGLIQFQFAWVDVLVFDETTSQATPADFDFNLVWNFQQPSLVLVGEGEERISLDREILVYSNNQNNSKIIFLNIRTGDGPTTANQNRIQVLNGSDEWVETAREWSVGGSGPTVSIQRLILMEVARLYIKPVKLMSSGVVFQDFAPSAHRRILYDEEIYLFMSGSIDAEPATINGIWFRILLSTPDPANISTREIYTNNINSPNATLGDPIRAELLVNRPQYQIFENFSGTLLLLDGDLVDIIKLQNASTLEIRQRLQVYKNGQKLIFNVGYTIDIDDNEITFNPDYESFGDYIEVMLFS